MADTFHLEPKSPSSDLNVLFPVEVVQIIRDLAAANNLSMSAVVRKAVAIGLDELTK